VSEEPVIRSTNTASLTVRQVLGLESPEGADLLRLQGQQYALLKDRLKVRFALHLAGVFLAAWVLWGSVNMLLVAAWGTAVMIAVIYSAHDDTRLADAEHRIFTVDEIKRHAVGTAIKGSAWSIGLIGFTFLTDPALYPSLWAIAALLILCTSASRFSAPLSSVVFASTLGLGACIASVLAGNWVLTVITLATALFSSFGVIECAKVGLAARLTEVAMQEKSEVVSMLLREFEEGQADWLWQVDTRRRLHSVSPRFAFALDKEPAEIEGQSFLQLISGSGWKTGKFPESLHELAEKLKRRENFSNLLVKVSINGEKRWWELSGTPIMDETGSYQGFRGVGSDVTEQRASSEKIAYLARYDTLTQLPNRLYINEEVGAALKYAEQWRTRCAFLMIDLDRFKAINDSLGHFVGDQMLAVVAERLKTHVGEGELCGRLGGDEFGLVIRDASDRRRVDALAQGIIKTLSEPYQIGNQTLYIGASVGSAFGPRDGKTVEELLRNADLALYRAKGEGGGEHCGYEPSLHVNAEEKRQLEFALRSAIEKNELVLHYQPVVDATDENLVSFEALVRWNSADHGFVSPGKFIPLAEETRLILPIGTWVMQEACREAAAHWPENIKINVNVSPEQLLEPDFVATVVSALSHSGLDPKRLEIEVTESIFVRDADIARKALEQCMSLGCSIALDDFGTGYSSLGYLRKLKFSTIKVDRTFVQGAAQNSPESLAIIRAVVAMAESLEMTTTAEGVENEDEAALIRRLGCTKIQGFHFGRPMPAGDARKIFARNGAGQQRKSA